MPKKTAVVELDAHLLRGIDALVREGRYTSRSEAIERALRERLRRHRRLEEQCALLDPDEERAFAEEGVTHSPADRWLC
jgi:Arc/MetJ-type ribon-helix-helix transcriptional regulator